ncbi:MAG: diacylglycerol/lipid kinase family protein [Candidatus Nanopelagicales bacterium]
MTHIAVVGNRNAGGGRASRALPMLMEALRAAGHGITLIDEPDVAAARESAHSVTNADALIACGGDGTVHFALQWALAAGLPLGIVPAGSGDDAARAVGLPHGRRRGDLARAIAHCVAHIGEARPVDVIWAETSDGTREAYLGVLAGGFDSSVNLRANGMRFPPGTAKYVVAMLRELRHFTPIAYQLEFEDTAMEVSGMLIAVGNGSTYGGGMKVCPGADVRDGRAEILIVGEMPKLAFLMLFPRVFTGTHVRHPVTRVLSASRFTLHAPDQDVFADGERIGSTPVRLSVEALAVRIIGAP